MAQITPVQPKRSNGLSTYLPVVGAIAGGIMGGPAGIGVGAGAGGVAGNFLASQDQGQPGQAVGGSGDSSALARRQAQMAADNGDPTNYHALVAAENAAGGLPEKMRQEYLGALTQARMLEQERLMRALERSQPETGVA